MFRRQECPRSITMSPICPSLVGLGLALAICTPSPSVAQAEAHELPSAVFQLVKAVVEEETRSARETVVYVDPKPIIVRHTREFPASDDYLDGSAEWFSALTAAARKAGSPMTTAFPVIESCTGYLVPPQFRETAGCPENQERILIFGFPEQEQTKKWRLPMISIDYSSGGRAVHSMDVYIVRSGAEWMVERKIIRVVFD